MFKKNYICSIVIMVSSFSVHAQKNDSQFFSEVGADSISSITLPVAIASEQSSFDVLHDVQEITLSDELAANITGGAIGDRFAALSKNQKTLAVVAAATYTVNKFASNFINVGSIISYGAKNADTLFCQTGIPLAGTFLGQSQLSQAKNPARDLDIVDVAITVAYGTVFTWLGTGCTEIFSIADRQYYIEKQAEDLAESKKEAFKNKGGKKTVKGRKLLMELNDQADWFEWAVKTADEKRNSLETAVKHKREIEKLRDLCYVTGISGWACWSLYTSQIKALNVQIADRSDSMRRMIQSARNAVEARIGNLRPTFDVPGQLGVPSKASDIVYDIN